MKKLSIGLRLTLWYLAIFALAQLIFGAGMWFILRHNLYDLVDDALETQVDDLKSFLEAQKKDATIAKLQEEVAETYSIEHAGDYLVLYAENDQLIYRSSFIEAHQWVVLSPNQVKRTLKRSRSVGGHAIRFAVRKFNVNDHTFTVEMGAPADDVVETLTQFRSYLLMFAPLLLLAAAGGGYWLSRRALSPVDALVRTARDVGGSNLSSRLQKLDTGDELQRLSDTLNEMLDRIETAFLRITQFTADASHELRTPVALIRTEAELALRRSREGAEYKESLRHILLEAERTTVLIEQLLSLARSDSGRETLDLQPVDLRQVLRGVVEGWQQVATIRDLEFAGSLGRSDSAPDSLPDSDDSDLFVLGDQAMLRRLADILLDNAFKYTSPPGSVRLTLESKNASESKNGSDSKNGSVVITVQDSGIGIAEEDQRRIFERFYRVDPARSRAQGGAGLGLAIAQWIVAQHHGSIAVESRPGHGSTFRVELPLIAAPVRSPQPA